MPGGTPYQPSSREQRFLDAIPAARYNRQIVSGLNRFIDRKTPEDMLSFYSERELAALTRNRDTIRDIESRMPVKLTRHYYELARNSKALQRLVKASPEETMDLAGSPDPANQMDYSPVEGLLHKYELGLIYVASTCSAHCRFCYREELIAGKTIPRSDGYNARKGLAQIGEVVAYIRRHNRAVGDNHGRHPQTGRKILREILLSGGDPMVLSNKKLAAWLSALAEAGIDAIRIGTKELAFFPDRFDQAFFTMLDGFHALYPRVQLRMMVHFNHPDEFLVQRQHGDARNPCGDVEWLPTTRQAVDELRQRPWISLDNQAPIIRGINDNPEALHILQRELRRAGIQNHYFFCGRDIVGHKAFNVPIERAWRIVNESQKGLSGVESHARLALSHFKGKVEVVAVVNDALDVFSQTGAQADKRVTGQANDGIVIFKLIRSPGDAEERSSISIVERNPEAIWLDGYEDRVLHDGVGLFSRAGKPVRHPHPFIQSVVAGQGKV